MGTLIEKRFAWALAITSPIEHADSFKHSEHSGSKEVFGLRDPVLGFERVAMASRQGDDDDDVLGLRALCVPVKILGVPL